jgi:Flp pilus assembly protein TadG
MNRIRDLLSRREDGSSSVSFVLIAPALVLVIGFLIFAGRISIAGNVVESSAAAAARDASLARTEAGSVANASEAARRVMTQQGVDCSSLNVGIDTSGLRVPLGQIGTVRATVTCQADLSDIGIPGIPGSKTLTSTASSPVDAYRQK